MWILDSRSLLLCDSAPQPHGKRGSSAGEEGGEDDDEEGGGAGAGGSFLGKEEAGGKGATRCVLRGGRWEGWGWVGGWAASVLSL